MTASNRKRLVVVGNGMVAHRLLDALRARAAGDCWQITVIGEETRTAYDRVALSSWFADGSGDALSLDPGCYDGTEVVVGERVVLIDRTASTVTTSTSRVVDYDALVLATGSAPFVPPIPGAESEGCLVYRTLDDLAAIKAAASRPGVRSACVVGGGLLGLEAANAMLALGLDTHVVEFAPRLMPVQVDEGGGEALRRHIEALGVHVHVATVTERIDPGVPLRMSFADGGALEADLIVFSAGIRPRDELARAAGLPVGERGGVVVDNTCRTLDPRIWAIGEVACLDGRTYGLVAPGYAMAEVVADRLLGGSATFPGADLATKLKLLGVDVASFGDAFATTAGALELVYADPVAGVYKKLVVTDDATRLLGGILVGDAGAYPLLRPMAGSDVPLSADPAELILPQRNGGADAAGAQELPGDAQVCSCMAVTKDVLCTAIAADGIADLGTLKSCTRAGTGCGSCVPLMNRILADELARAGMTVSKRLCEHFEHSRAELFDIIRVKGLTTFSEVVAAHGQGRGCDICKPTVASILASLGTGHVLSGEQAALQDTNDHHLANLQKDGTYSVVPRIPGGEITPDRLICIGEVARDFGLYTKITGGQRIDLLGARVEQLPAIWQRLVDAGFESGHAYGKALRTVKSCVGSTWCRYGVQDSVGLAIELELRYRGLRAPHKIKAGVSGCARECAEARGKDFGVIATDKGWNLYLGGNGGFSPRHAQLFLQDVDSETLVRTIDRFLMFYVRTADRLQRTAAWLESLEGGLHYLREVIVDDSLGICTELDAAMARHVASYEDEWATTLTDPDKLRRFASFVNAPDTPDPTVVMVTERGQPRPARPHERGEVLQ